MWLYTILSIHYLINKLRNQLENKLDQDHIIDEIKYNKCFTFWTTQPHFIFTDLLYLIGRECLCDHIKPCCHINKENIEFIRHCLDKCIRQK